MNFSYLRREPGFYRRVFTLALPVVLQNLITTSLGFMDTFMVGLVGQEQMSAVTVANVPIYIIQLIVFGLQSGSRVLISQFWGRGDRESINRVMGIGFFVAGGISTLCALTMGLFPRQVLMLITDNARLVELGTSYIRIVGFSYILNSLSSIYIGMQQSIENPRFGMTVFAISTVCNTVGNYILIFGKLGLPALGITGAAIATVIGQAFGALAGFLFHLKHNKEVNIRLSDCRPDGRIILDIYRIGFPSILMVGIGSLTNYLMNRILMAFTSTAVALYGAYFKLQSFFFMPVFGLNNGIVPIVGYNYGARKKERIYRTICYGVLYAVCILAVGLLLFEAIPGVLLQAFSPSEHMLAIGIPALRKIAIHFPIAAFCIVGGSVCQALGKSLYSFFTSVLRQVVALIPAAYLLSLTGNVGNVWWCFPIAEVVSACATAFFLRRALRNMDRELTLAEGQ